MANGQPRGTIWLARSIYWLDAWSLQQSRLYSYAGNLSSESRQRCHYIWIRTQLGGNNVLELVWLLVCGACVLERAPWRRQKMACGSKPWCSGCGSVCVLQTGKRGGECLEVGWAWRQKEEQGRGGETKVHCSVVVSQHAACDGLDGSRASKCGRREAVFGCLEQWIPEEVV